MAKIEYHRDRGNYLEIYDHESLNDINDALYEYCEKTSVTDAPDAFVELPVYLRDIYAIRTPPVSVIHIGYVRLSNSTTKVIFPIVTTSDKLNTNPVLPPSQFLPLRMLQASSLSHSSLHTA
ncbi:MAG: hypothetical protein HUK10_13030 [Bacteroides heparinolyticus]|nr:hypothetical protein [Bacteroides heparinolyticus]